MSGPRTSASQNASRVSLRLGNSSGLAVIRSIGVSGRATSPTAPMVSSAMTRSGRSGGRTRSALSFMLDLRRERGLYLVGEQQLVDAPLQRIESGRAHVAKADV